MELSISTTKLNIVQMFHSYTVSMLKKRAYFRRVKQPRSISNMCMPARQHYIVLEMVPSLKVAPGRLASKCSSSFWSTSAAADWVACCLDLD